MRLCLYNQPRYFPRQPRHLTASFSDPSVQQPGTLQQSAACHKPTRNEPRSDAGSVSSFPHQSRCGIVVRTLCKPTALLKPMSLGDRPSPLVRTVFRTGKRELEGYLGIKHLKLKVSRKALKLACHADRGEGRILGSLRFICC